MCGLLAYRIGDMGQGGGKIFYASETGFSMTDNNQVCHYLEAAPADIAGAFAWASSDYASTSIATGMAIGTGRKNTALILTTDANAPAAKACKEYNNNGKTDWFLPSRDELNELYKNKALVYNIDTDYPYYWSSSQYSEYDIRVACGQDFN